MVLVEIILIESIKLTNPYLERVEPRLYVCPHDLSPPAPLTSLSCEISYRWFRAGGPLLTVVSNFMLQKGCFCDSDNSLFFLNSKYSICPRAAYENHEQRRTLSSIVATLQ